jgi:hypothetical protein
MHEVHVLKGGWAEIDLLVHREKGADWAHDICPWTIKDNRPHRCAFGGGWSSHDPPYICDYFVQFGDGIAIDNIHCSYPHINPI